MKKVALNIQSTQIKQATGFGYYVSGLYDSLCAAKQNEIEIIPIKSRYDKDLSTLERLYNDAVEFPSQAVKASADIIHQPAFSCPRSSKPVLWTFHDVRSLILNEPMSLSGSFYWKKWLPWSARFADVIVCTSENGQKDLLKYTNVSAEKTRVIPVGLPEAVESWKLNPATWENCRHKWQLTGPFFSSLGTIQPIKNYPFLIDVFVALRKEYNLKHQLVIIGKKGWDYPAVAKKIAEHNLVEGRDVIITDYVTDDEKWTLIAESDVFLFPSLYEGFGIPPLEAQALQTPVLCADNSSLPSVVGQGALLCETTNVDSWLQSYAALKTNREELIQKGHDNTKRFYWDKIAAAWMNLYKEL